MSRITGAGFASGAIGAGVNEAVINEIAKIKDPGTAQIASAIIGAAAAKATGGNVSAGASAAASGTKDNAYRESPTYNGAFIVRNNQIYIVTDGKEVPYHGDIPYETYFWIEDTDTPWYGWDYKRTFEGDIYVENIPLYSVNFPFENRVYSITIMMDTDGQKKVKLNALGSLLADSMLHRLVGVGVLNTIPKNLILGVKNKDWDIDPRNIPEKLDGFIDKIKDFINENKN